MRRASCDLQHEAGIRVARAQAPLRWLSLGRWRNTLACRVRARRAALVVIGLRTIEGYCTGKKPLCSGARPWCDVRAVTSIAQSAFTWHANKRHYAGCLSGGGETRRLAVRARRAALVVISLRTMEGYCTGKKPVSFSARPWCDVRVVTSKAQPAFTWHADKLHCPGCLSGGGETRKLAARARAPCRAGCDRSTHYRKTCTGERPLTLSATPWFDVRAVSSNAQLAFAWYANKRYCAGCISGGGETRELAARARRAALTAIGLRGTEGHCTGERLLFFGARPWCDVRTVAPNT